MMFPVNKKKLRIFEYADYIKNLLWDKCNSVEIWDVRNVFFFLKWFTLSSQLKQFNQYLKKKARTE